MRSLGRIVTFLALAAAALPAAAQPPIDVRPRQASEGEEVEVYLFGVADGCAPDFQFESVKQDLVILRGTIPQTILPCPPGPWQDKVVLPPLKPRSYRIEARIGENPPGAILHAVATLEVALPDIFLPLHDGSFVASVGWYGRHGGGASVGYAKALTSESGWFWFFSPENVEITLKVLDGTPVNGHWWVFLASMTDVEYTVTIQDNRTGCLSQSTEHPPCPSWTYTSRPFVNENRLDTAAFPAEP